MKCDVGIVNKIFLIIGIILIGGFVGYFLLSSSLDSETALHFCESEQAYYEKIDDIAQPQYVSKQVAVNWCYHDVAIETDNVSLCERIDRDYKNGEVIYGRCLEGRLLRE